MSNYISKSDFKALNHGIMLKGDVDSIYFGHSSFYKVMRGFGPPVKSFVDSCKHRLDSAVSCRFGLCLKNPGEEKVMIDLNGVYPDKIRLDYLPNIKLMECQVDGISPRFFINMYYIGVGKIRPTTYLRNIELKAVTALLNCARENTITLLEFKLEGLDEEMDDAKRASQVDLELFSDMHLFESITGGSQDKWIKNRPTCLSNSSARLFASQFDKVLKKYTTCSHEEFVEKFSDSAYVGCHNILSESEEETELSEMRSFIRKLHKGVFFCASCAGCKRDFQIEEEAQILMKFDSSEDNLAESEVQFKLHCNKLKQLALKRLKKCLFGAAGNEGDDDEPLQFFHNIDIGIEVSPSDPKDSFFLKGREARDAAKDMLKERRVLDEHSFSPNPNVLRSNLTLSPDDNELIEYGTTLRFSNDHVFEFGENNGEISNSAGGKFLDE